MIVPSLQTIGCLESWKCASACPLPPLPSKFFLEHPKCPHVIHSHKLELISQEPQWERAFFFFLCGYDRSMFYYSSCSKYLHFLASFGAFGFCCRVKTCSQGVISNSHTFNSSCRVADLTLITAAIACVSCSEVDLIGALQVKQKGVCLYSYRSSESNLRPPSTPIATFVSFCCCSSFILSIQRMRFKRKRLKVKLTKIL